MKIHGRTCVLSIYLKITYKTRGPIKHLQVESAWRVKKEVKWRPEPAAKDNNAAQSILQLRFSAKMAGRWGQGAKATEDRRLRGQDILQLLVCAADLLGQSKAGARRKAPRRIARRAELAFAAIDSTGCARTIGTAELAKAPTLPRRSTTPLGSHPGVWPNHESATVRFRHHGRERPAPSNPCRHPGADHGCSALAADYVQCTGRPSLSRA